LFTVQTPLQEQAFKPARVVQVNSGAGLQVFEAYLFMGVREQQLVALCR